MSERVMRAVALIEARDQASDKFARLAKTAENVASTMKKVEKAGAAMNAAMIKGADPANLTRAREQLTKIRAEMQEAQAKAKGLAAAMKAGDGGAAGAYAKAQAEIKRLAASYDRAKASAAQAVQQFRAAKATASSVNSSGPARANIGPGVEWAPRAGQAGIRELTPSPGFRKMKAMVRHRTHSVEFKRQVALEYLAGDTLKGLSRRHDISRNLVRLWVKKFEAGEFDEDAVAIDLVQQYEARIAALERLVGKQALEIEFLKGAHKLADRRRSAPTSAIVGPPASASPKDAA